MQKVLMGLLGAVVLITLSACKPGVYADFKPGPKGQPKSITPVQQNAKAANTTTG